MAHPAWGMAAAKHERAQDGRAAATVPQSPLHAADATLTRAESPNANAYLMVIG